MSLLTFAPLDAVVTPSGSGELLASGLVDGTCWVGQSGGFAPLPSTELTADRQIKVPQLDETIR